MNACSDYDSSAYFTGLQTFSWLSKESFLTPTAEEPHATELNDLRIRNAVEIVMANNDFIKTPLDESDLAVSFTIGTRQKIETSTYGAGWYSYNDWYVDRVVISDPQVQTYTEGTLAIDIFDRASKKQIWHGWASERNKCWGGY